MLSCISLKDLYLDYYAYQENFAAYDLLFDKITKCSSVLDIAESKELSDNYGLYLNTNYTQEHKKQCNSSGSTGEIKPFYFLCNYEFNVKIERFNKAQSLTMPIVRVLPQFLTRNRRPGLNILKRDRPGYTYDYVLYARSPNIKSLIEVLESIKEKVAINAPPNFWLYCNSFIEFQDYLIRRKTTIISSDHSSLYKKKRLVENGVHINDCMIDYSTGRNFYTCNYNHKHIMPTFSDILNSSVNLLNLFKNNFIKQSGDTFRIGKQYDCKCGRRASELKFVPHADYVNHLFSLKDQISEQLIGIYLNLQIIKTSDKLVCCFHSYDSMPKRDEEYLREVGVTEFYADSKVYTSTSNNKIECLYNNIDGKPITFIT
jgi:hypothetical protein